MVNANKLRGKIAEAGLTQAEIAKMIGMSKNTFTNKINGTTDFTINEAIKICEALKITDCTVKVQFF